MNEMCPIIHIYIHTYIQKRSSTDLYRAPGISAFTGPPMFSKAFPGARVRLRLHNIYTKKAFVITKVF
jgi:hypothetical protein